LVFLALTFVRIALAVAGAFVAIVLFKLPRRRAIVWIPRYVLGLAVLALSVLQIAGAFPPGTASLVAVELLAGGTVIAALAIDELVGRDLRGALERARK
jgi:peptidoglycan/LPS O-acetylase OafA/YrhL